MFFMSLTTIVFSSTAQPLAVQHTSGQATGASYSQSHDLTRSPLGDLFMAGEFQGPMVMEDSTYSSTGIAGLSTPDGFITKYNSTGEYAWTVQIQSEIYGKVDQVIYQPNKGCWALINSMNGTMIDTISYSHPGDFIYVLALFSDDGVLLRSEQITASGNIYDLHFALGNSGEMFITGMLEGVLTLGNYTLQNANSATTGFLLKLEENGSVAWGQKIGNANLSLGHPATGNDGEVYLTGKFYADTQIPAVFGAQTITKESIADLFIARFDSTGNLDWLSVSPNADQNNSPSAKGWATAFDPAGFLYVTGEFAGASLELGSIMLTNDHTGKDFFLARLETDGAVLWAVNNGGMTQAARGKELAVGDQGEIFVQGTYGVGTIGGHQMVLGSGAAQVTLPYTADEDLFQAAYSSTGNLLWAEPGTGRDDDFSGGIVATGNGGAAFSGGFSDSLLLPDTVLISTPDPISTNAFLTWSGGGSTSIRDQIIPASWTLSPNPTTGAFETSVPRLTPLSRWKITTLTGQVLVDEQANELKQAWDLKTLPPGIYLMSLENAGGISTRRFILTK